MGGVSGRRGSSWGVARLLLLLLTSKRSVVEPIILLCLRRIVLLAVPAVWGCTFVVVVVVVVIESPPPPSVCVARLICSSIRFCLFHRPQSKHTTAPVSSLLVGISASKLDWLLTEFYDQFDDSEV